MIYFFNFQIIFPQKPYDHYHHFIPSYGHNNYGGGGHYYSSCGGRSEGGSAEAAATSVSSLHAINDYSQLNQLNKKLLTYTVPFPMKIRESFSNSNSHSSSPSIVTYPEIREI